MQLKVLFQFFERFMESSP